MMRHRSKNGAGCPEAGHYIEKMELIEERRPPPRSITPHIHTPREIVEGRSAAPTRSTTMDRAFMDFGPAGPRVP